MNGEKIILVQRLKDAGLSLRRFLKVNETKRAFEKEWQNKLYTPEELKDYQLWGICGGGGLVLIDADNQKMAEILKHVLPPTFEVLSSRRKLPTFISKSQGGTLKMRFCVSPKLMRLLEKYELTTNTLLRRVHKPLTDYTKSSPTNQSQN